MLKDIQTILWKEWKELLTGRGVRGGWLNLLIVLGVFGIFLPYQFGHTLVTSPLSLAVWLWVPAFLVLQVIADSFAGERERHTLETLLASRLSDRAILLGKIAAAMTYGCGLSLVSLILGLVTLNLAFGHGQLILYPLVTSMGIIAFTLLAGGLTATLGVLISLRAATVRQAYQVMSISIMVLLFGGVYGLQGIAKQLPPATSELVARWLTQANLGQIILVCSAFLAIINTVLLAAALARFQRAKLILD
jgi:ABC-2 type transport system permease protein